MQADLTKEKEVKTLKEKTVKLYNKLDILVNNTGGLVARHKAEDISNEFWNHVMSINLTLLEFFFNVRDSLRPFMKIQLGYLCETIKINKIMNLTQKLLSKIDLRIFWTAIIIIIFVGSNIPLVKNVYASYYYSDKINSSANFTVSDSIESPVEFISSYFENASPLFWEYNPDGSVLVRLLFDKERSSPNRASNHWHFQVHAKAGSTVTIIMDFFHEVWNGRQVASYSLVNNYFISQDGVHWTTITADHIENVGHKLQLHMNSNTLYVAGMEPYRISDLDKLLAEIRKNRMVEIHPIGNTVEGRQLEIIRIGRSDAPFRVFMRARAHPWEAGGNWLIQGLIRSLLEEDTNAPPYLDKYCIYILPMANKDGVARGMTRFNTMGIDLNRGQHLPADLTLAPENFALEAWLKKMTDKGMQPNLSMDVHNDRSGRLTLSGRPFVYNYLPPTNVNPVKVESNFKRLESLMYKYTWYTWNTVNSENYYISRHDVDISCTLELNQTWIDGLNKIPFGEDWELMGRQLRDVFYYYFEDNK